MVGVVMIRPSLPAQHPDAEREVNHRFVVQRHQLLAHRFGERRQAASAASSEDDRGVNRVVSPTPALFRHRDMA